MGGCITTITAGGDGDGMTASDKITTISAGGDGDGMTAGDNITTITAGGDGDGMKTGDDINALKVTTGRERMAKDAWTMWVGLLNI